ncbi:sulfate permease, SulP family [Dethiosulfatibacter aminovorans DSM 17477]|uniref:Sulfate permease, SulP family n=1 Tax=Dethiosulfatibacter aminovorans DSM 17477 TaxID=1121476 RepID=A0A1M6GMG3_9FIRM|nr:sulfate permease [Dethiosulfatibacter aminovorans]SHJ11138.1 sulfate permease, SulP family [Dethiosulfatibacter aminovorans DSM 17477]
MSKLQPKLISTVKDYSKEQFFNDVTAGIIVAIIALPLSIALAIASGVSPEKGLYTAIVAGFIISLLGGSRVQIGGPTGAFMIIVYGIVVNYGIEGLTIATILAGIIMILMGIMKFGGVIKYIPYPITTGFTSGIALTIFSSQIKDFLGLSIDSVPVEFLDKWKAYIGAMDTISIQTISIGILALVIILAWPRVNKKIPGALIALIATSVVVQLFDMDVATIGTKFGEISSDLPEFKTPGFTMDKIKYLIEPAITIAILGSIESLLSAVVSDGMIGGKHRSNMELIAQGIANIMSGFFGGIPATGAIARTVANIKNGGRTPVAGIVHALTLLFILVIFMPLAKMVPLTSLAAVLIVVAYNMSEWREFKQLFKSPKSDILVLLITFFVTVLIDLVKAIEIGMVLSSFLFMKRMGEVTNVNVNDLDASEEDDDGKRIYEENILNTFDVIKVYEINGPFFFGAADKFMAALSEIGDKTNILVLRMRNVPAMDATALNAFDRMLDICRHRKIKILVSGINKQPYSVLEKAGLTDIIGEENFFKTVREAVDCAQDCSEGKNCVDNMAS